MRDNLCKKVLHHTLDIVLFLHCLLETESENLTGIYWGY